VIDNEVMRPVGTLPERPTGLGNAEPLRVIGVGGVVARKGPLIAVQTLSELIRRGVNAELTWVGEGEQREEMLEVAARLGVADRVHLTGQLNPEALSDELLRHDLFLLPVETETFGVAIAEALTHGLPVVATGRGGHEEFMPRNASRLVAEREAGPLADAVQSLLADAELPARFQIAESAQARFSEERRRGLYREVYEKAVGSSSRR
jgi:glycosyltransferase involved in cell wall biosynthesis